MNNTFSTGSAIFKAQGFTLLEVKKYFHTTHRASLIWWCCCWSIGPHQSKLEQLQRNINHYICWKMLFLKFGLLKLNSGLFPKRIRWIWTDKGWSWGTQPRWDSYFDIFLHTLGSDEGLCCSKVCVVCEGFDTRTQHPWYDQYVVILQTNVEVFFFF